MKEKLQEIHTLIKNLQQNAPEETKNFFEFLKSVEKDGAVSAKNKELINIALAVAAQCEWCIAFHTQNAIKLGATKEEIVEAGMQAVLMHGGPALMYLTPLFNAIEEFGNE
ncbi:DNA-binding protein [Nautilia profundicola AmH]|uniref:DNA-binding protein n=1 Tax=Nautilia profundicola (strain ATCC BAA-1463 / DSM 18972 / AmH) TaxID=598659 RepID=B9L968_NAUPA|nr:carboxymuconolactone decarboxylase family protein [Nautilia profundicola]ACM93088.1 DNA-binding protein [Nautilia profundicola AmH]